MFEVIKHALSAIKTGFPESLRVGLIIGFQVLVLCCYPAVSAPVRVFGKHKPDAPYTALSTHGIPEAPGALKERTVGDFRISVLVSTRLVRLKKLLSNVCSGRVIA